MPIVFNQQLSNKIACIIFQVMKYLPIQDDTSIIDIRELIFWSLALQMSVYNYPLLFSHVYVLPF